jgi:hypothetical protein
VLKYPHIKKNAASSITQQYPDSAYKSKVTCSQCFSFLKNLHSSNSIHSIPRLTQAVVVLQCVYDPLLHATHTHCKKHPVDHCVVIDSIFAVACVQRLASTSKSCCQHRHAHCHCSSHCCAHSLDAHSDTARPAHGCERAAPGSHCTHPADISCPHQGHNNILLTGSEAARPGCF